MREGLILTVVDVDPDYLGIEIRVASARFSGSTRIYAGLTELNEFADRIAGFPTNSVDERTYDFGSRNRGVAGGYCSLRFRCIDSVGHANVEISIEDDKDRHGLGTAEFSFPVFAADVDEFATGLRTVEIDQNGAAILRAMVSSH